MSLNEYKYLKGASDLVQQLEKGETELEDDTVIGNDTFGDWYNYEQSSERISSDIMEHVLTDYLRYVFLQKPENICKLSEKIVLSSILRAVGVTVITDRKNAYLMVERIIGTEWWCSMLFTYVMNLSVETDMPDITALCCRSRKSLTLNRFNNLACSAPSSARTSYIPDYNAVRKLISRSREDIIRDFILEDMKKKDLEEVLDGFFNNSGYFGMPIRNSRFNDEKDHYDIRMPEIECACRYLETVFGKLCPKEDIGEKVCETVNKRFNYSHRAEFEMDCSTFISKELPVFIKRGIRLENCRILMWLFSSYLIESDTDDISDGDSGFIEMLEQIKPALSDDFYFDADFYEINSLIGCNGFERLNRFLDALTKVISADSICMRVKDFNLEDKMFRSLIRRFDNIRWDCGSIEYIDDFACKYRSPFELLLKKNAFTDAQLDEIFNHAIENKNTKLLKIIAPYIKR